LSLWAFLLQSKQGEKIMLNPNLFVHACAGLLDVKKPIEIRMKTHAKKSEKSMAAFCTPYYRRDKVLRFVITVNLESVIESGFCLYSVIAHEICHAAQFTHGVFNENKHHDKKFHKLCEILERETKKLGFPLQKLYSPITDTD
jgi:predicted metal-dependent hydrolase